MKQRNQVALARVVGVLIAAASLPAIAQSWPTKPVRVVTTQPGSSAELMGRLIAPGLSSALGQQVVIDNRGLIAAEIVARAPADGYTLLLYTSPLWIAPFFRDVQWDPVRDYAPATPAARLPTMASAGLAGYESVSLSGFLASAKTPAAIIERLSQEIIRMLRRNDIRDRLFGMGLQVVAGTPEEFAATIQREMAKWGRLIRDAGLRE